MKYISLSFDDARADTYAVAKKILDQYGIRATVNVVSDFIMHPEHYSDEKYPYAMTEEEVLDWQRWGGEVACHGSTHKNTIDDLKNNIAELSSIGINTNGIGFASPESVLTEGNISEKGFIDAKEKGLVSYLRSGIQVRREGLWYVCVNVLEKFTHSRGLYYIQNKRCIFNVLNPPVLLLSMAIKDYTKESQVEYVIKKMKDNEALILMFHSILNRSDELYGRDHYFWDSENFKGLCNFLVGQKDICVVITKDLLNVKKIGDR